MDIFAVGIGKYDLAGGVDNLLAIDYSKELFISANLLHKKDSSPVFSTHKIKQVGTTRVIITSVTKKTKTVEGYYKFANPTKALTSLFDDLQISENDFVVILSSLSFGESKSLATTVPLTDLIITADSSRGSIKPILVNNVIITQSIERGKHLDELQLSNLGGIKWLDSYTKKEKKLTMQLNSILGQLERISNRKNISQSDTILQLEKQRDSLTQQLTLLYSEITSAESAMEIKDYKYLSHRLHKDIIQDGIIDQILNQ